MEDDMLLTIGKGKLNFEKMTIDSFNSLHSTTVEIVSSILCVP